jgi:anaerobic magnesium-protoporphyrin IX monomethyl ester cyclase
MYVMDTIDQSLYKYNLESVSFDNDSFDTGKLRILKLCTEIKRRGPNRPWTAIIRADTAGYEMLEAMTDTGLYATKFGGELGVQVLVDATNQMLNLEKVKETVCITKDLGVKVHRTFTPRLPGEILETTQRTIDFAISADPDSFQFSISTPYPGIPYYEMAKANGMLTSKDWTDFDGADTAVIHTDTFSPEHLFRALRNSIWQWCRHHLRQTFWKNKGYYLRQALRNPWRSIEFLRGNP